MTEGAEQGWARCLELIEQIRAILDRYRERFGPEIEEWRRHRDEARRLVSVTSDAEDAGQAS